LESLQKSCPNTQLVDGTDVFEYARLVKTPAEIDVFRAAAYYTDKAILTSFALAKVGDTERDVASRMRAIALELGADDLVHAHFQTGVHSTVVHAWPTDIPIKPGEVFHVDTGAVFGGYRTDLARNAVVEVATRRQEEMYRHMWEIQQIVLERMRPGAVARDLFELAQKEFKKVGLIYPWGTLGHSTGITGHEGFEITADSDQVLESGMLVNIEPSHIEDDDARYHIEDTILITEGEPEILSCFADTERLFVIK
jgi:Xaa-Pro aminopeptidase